MPSRQHPLYFIAIIPPSPAREDLQALKEYFKEEYNSKASLNSPPHITLHMPFRFSDKKRPILLKVLENVAADHSLFQLELKDFSAFTPRVIFADVVKNEVLMSLQKSVMKACRQDLKLLNANYKDQAYHPHVTLAFRDLKKPAFAEAWKEFETRKFEASFLVKHFCLLKHDGAQWQVDTEFGLC